MGLVIRPKTIGIQEENQWEVLHTAQQEILMNPGQELMLKGWNLKRQVLKNNLGEEMMLKEWKIKGQVLRISNSLRHGWER